MTNDFYKDVTYEEDYTGSYMNEEHTGSALGALAETMNTGVALLNRHEMNKQQVDLNAYADTAFTKENYLAEFNKIDNEWMKDKLAESHINSWEQFEKRKRYLTHYEEQEKLVADTYSTGAMLALGLPMAVLDVDSLLISPALSVANKVRKTMNLRSRLSKIASHATVGAMAGAGSEVLYQATTGVSEDGAVTNSALVGMVLGGGLGTFLDHTKAISTIKNDNVNAIEKLTIELDGKDVREWTTADFEKSAPMKEIHPVMRRMVISPIEKLLTSENKAVQGLASMLHIGTLHRGALDTHTASTVRKRYDAGLNVTHRNIYQAHSKAVQDGDTPKKFNEWEEDVAMEANKIVARMQRDATEGIDGTLKEADRAELIMTRLNTTTRRYTNPDDVNLNKAVDELLDYYERIQKSGKDLDFKGLERTASKGYMPRNYSKEKIESFGRDVSIERLIQAQSRYAHANNIELDLPTFTERATKAVDSTLDNSAKLRKVTDPYGTKEQLGTSRLSTRSIQAYEDDLAELLEMDVAGSTSLYGLSMHGRLALKEKLGVDSMEEIENLLENVGATTKEKDNFRVIADTILGTREMAKNPFNVSQRAIKAVGSYSSLMHTMGFGIPTITEVASIAKEFGWGQTIKHLVPSIKAIHHLYKNGTSSDINQIGLIGEFGTALMGHRSNRLETGDDIMKFGRVQEYVDNATRKLSIWGGLMPITDALKLGTISAGVDFLATLSVRSKISATDIKRLEDMGFTINDLPLIRDKLQVDSTGKINNMKSDSWGKLRERMTDGLSTLTDRTILHPDGATLPKLMTDVNEGAFVSRIVMKFMRFPVESYERMFLRGIQELDIKQATAVAGNVGMWALILTAKDATSDRPRYDLGTGEGMTSLMKDSILMNSWTAGVTAFGDRVSSTLTGKNLFNDYSPAVAGAPAMDLKRGLWQHDPTFNAMGHNIHIGKAVGDFMNTVGLLDEATKE